MQNVELQWFNCIKNDLDAIEDSKIFNIPNVFTNLDLNILVGEFKANIKRYETLRRALRASFDALHTLRPKSELKQYLSTQTGLKDMLNTYEEEIFERFAKNELSGIGLELSTANNRPELHYNEILEETKNKIAAIEDNISVEIDMTKDQAAVAIIDRIMEMNNPNSQEYTKSGIAELDDIIFGFKRGNYIIIAGRPSMGKTAIGISFMINFVKQGRKCAFLSVEMAKDAIIERCSYTLAGVENDSFTNGQGIDQGKFKAFSDAITEIKNNKKYLFINPVRKYIADVCRAIRKAKRDNPDLDVVFVDYLQKIDGSDPRKDERLQIKEISDKLCELGKRLKITMIPLAQLSRDSDGEIPQMKHLKGGSDMEQDADMLIFIHRSKKAQHEAKENGKSETYIFGEGYDQTINSLQSYLIVQKNRNGAIGMAKSLYDAPCMKFYSYENIVDYNSSGF